MSALAAHVRHGSNDVAGQFLLDAQIPLLQVRPNGLFGNRGHRQRKEQASAADVRVAGDVELLRRQNERRRSFERFGIAFVSIGVLKEDAITAADGHLAVAARIPSEADALRRVEEMTAHAAGVGTSSDARAGESRHGESAALAAALDDSVEGIPRAGNESAR